MNRVYIKIMMHDLPVQTVNLISQKGITEINQIGQFGYKYKILSGFLSNIYF